MLDAWIIDHIRKEREKRENESRVPLQLPLPAPPPDGPTENPPTDRGVVEIDYRV